MSPEDKQRQVGQLVGNYQAAAEALRHVVERVQNLRVHINAAAGEWDKLAADGDGKLVLGPSEVEFPTSREVAAAIEERDVQQRKVDELWRRLANLGVVLQK